MSSGAKKTAGQIRREIREIDESIETMRGLRREFVSARDAGARKIAAYQAEIDLIKEKIAAAPAKIAGLDKKIAALTAQKARIENADKIDELEQLQRQLANLGIATQVPQRTLTTSTTKTVTEVGV